MVIISEGYWPAESSKEIGKVFLEMQPLPEYITLKGPFIVSTAENGIRSVFLYEFEDARTAEAFRAIQDWHAKFFDVPGYSQSQHLWLEAAECLNMIGMGD